MPNISKKQRKYKSLHKTRSRIKQLENSRDLEGNLVTIFEVSRNFWTVEQNERLERLVLAKAKQTEGKA